MEAARGGHRAIRQDSAARWRRRSAGVRGSVLWCDADGPSNLQNTFYSVTIRSDVSCVCEWLSFHWAPACAVQCAPCVHPRAPLKLAEYLLFSHDSIRCCVCEWLSFHWRALCNPQPHTCSKQAMVAEPGLCTVLRAQHALPRRRLGLTDASHSAFLWSGSSHVCGRQP